MNLNKVKFYLSNAFFSAMIGAVISIISASLVFHRPRIVWFHLFFCMAIGGIIGTASLFFLFQVFLRLKARPLLGFLTNFLVVAALNWLGAILTGYGPIGVFTNIVWLTAFIVSEILSFFLTYIWYRRILVYNQRLEMIKASSESSMEL